ncbi:MAG: DUF4443 domain-containing protein [Nitrosopumilus sp.]|nr:DUF4443 domain-containing protein [Nitrosopumilus sp.]
MHLLTKTLKTISSNYAPSRILSFNSAHILKTLQLIEKEGNVSRNLLINQLGLGEGSIKTLIKHLKMEKMIRTTNKGTMLSERGREILEEISQYIYSETILPKCSISVGEHNHAVLLRNLRFAIKQGVEQRDVAIKMGAKGATTLVYKNGKFLIPDSNYNALRQEGSIEKLMKEKLTPINDDIIIIGSDDKSYIVAEIASKSAALFTLENHENH